jgi:hypothetical protein
MLRIRSNTDAQLVERDKVRLVSRDASAVNWHCYCPRAGDRSVAANLSVDKMPLAANPSCISVSPQCDPIASF